MTLGVFGAVGSLKKCVKQLIKAWTIKPWEINLSKPKLKRSREKTDFSKRLEPAALFWKKRA
jgi:hypothetical protein